MKTKTFPDFDAFYAYYLDSHRSVWNRRIHLSGWVLGAAAAIWALLTLHFWLIPLALIGSLALALLGHQFIERNDSVVFSYPVWTTCADMRMFSDMAHGRLPL